jgi:hypothetical protein
MPTPIFEEEKFTAFIGSSITVAHVPVFVYGVYVGARMTEGVHYTRSGDTFNFTEALAGDDVVIVYNH